MEINWGLGRDTNLSSNIKSYITYVSSLPSGREEGEYLALDLGGTNFRSADSVKQYQLTDTNLSLKSDPHPIGLREHQCKDDGEQASCQGGF